MKKILYILVIVIVAISVRKVNAYTEYKVGDEITYNDIKFYVIKDSSGDEDTVTMLKAEPLTVEEVNLYGGVGTENNHVNMYVTSDTTAPYYQTASNQNGYGGMAYYSSTTCTNVYGDKSGCKNSYALSEVKYVVDAWAVDKIANYEEVRLLNHDDLITNLGYINSFDTNKTKPSSGGETPTWVYNSNYWYWTSSAYNDSRDSLWVVRNNGYLHDNGYKGGVLDIECTVRPVITLSKVTLGDEDETIKDNTDNKENNIDTNDNNNNEIKSIVKVDNTYMSKSIILIIIGFIILGISIFALYKLSNKKISE